MFVELLELYDFSLKPSLAGEKESCDSYHFYPRFVRELPENGKEVLAMSHVLRYLLDNSGPLVDQKVLKEKDKMGQFEWQDFVDTGEDFYLEILKAQKIRIKFFQTF